MRWNPMKLLLGAVLATGLAASGAVAQSDFPNKPIRVIFPYAAGGGDYPARQLFPEMTRILGQQFVLESRDGAGAAIGTAYVKGQPADGYTLLFVGTSAVTVVPHLRDVGFTVDDFAAIGNAVATPLVLVARADLPYRTLPELLAYAKANPGKVNMASTGVGTSTHMTGEALQLAAGVKFTHVPFRGLSVAMTGLLGGDADILVGLIGPLSPHMQAGKLNGLATTGSKRTDFLSALPTLKESGFEIVEETKFGFLAPRGTPDAVRKRLADALGAAVNNPEFSEQMKKNFTGVSYLDSSTFQTVLKQESDYWAKLLADPRFKAAIQQ